MTSRAAARAVTADGVVLLPDRAGPLSGPTAQGLLAHELVHVEARRAARPERSAPADADREERQALAAEAAVRAGTAPPPVLTTPWPALAAPRQAAERVATAPAAVSALPALDPARPWGHAAVERPPDRTPDPAPTQVVRAPEAPAPPSPASRDRTDDPDLERLYRTLTDRLRHELLLERERTGRLVDPAWR